MAAASLTILMIWESVVSSPTLDASQRINPDWFKVAAETRSPAALSDRNALTREGGLVHRAVSFQHDTIHG